ncbi:MAG: UvrD-helicase domain-containing protein [Tannerella sp.]|jgi:ATP-dependent exoDNAse (exonuclease V) beta subunit|nr:UvrD-helicase domain-containing protein [Tannerella sp.]
MLTIYRASAGTGKTHTLTGEYLRLLFKGADRHSHILSVTFTNKATEEMKSRILKELHLIASGRRSSYLPQLAEECGRTEEQIRRQAKQILIRVLHDYSAFNISTIDHFFQQVMRAFVRELGLQGNYRIEMDVEAVLHESIDNLLAGLDRPENKDLLGWLLRFSEDRVERGENWDIRREVMRLGYELFKEKYKTSSEDIGKDIEDKQSLGEYRNMLWGIIRSTEAEARRLGEQALAVMSRHALTPSDFKGGSRSPLHLFARLSEGVMSEPSAAFAALAENEDARYAKTAPPHRRAAIDEAFRDGLDDCVRRTVRFFDNLTHYRTARETTRFYYTLGILNDISRRIKAHMEERNAMLIADTTDLLNKIVDGSDVPFIYEKTGTRIDHYMIDEFQDTSEMQWRNFRPLIDESLSCGHDNLIVGDVKQSIYRFRNSDWTLLDEQVGKDFPENARTEKTLTDNWRSHRLIVEFNNAFFTVAPQLLRQYFIDGTDKSALDDATRDALASKIVSAYAKSAQHVSPPFRDKDGHVRIEFLSDGDESDWKEEALSRLPHLIAQLQDKGYALRDIAVLVRTRAEGAAVADTLLACKETHADSPCGYDIISEDALIIGNSSAARFLVAVMQYVNRPDDAVLRKFAHMQRIALRLGRNPASADSPTGAPTSPHFPAEILSELKRLSHRSFYEMAEGIYRLFEQEIPEQEQIFVQSFLDLVSEYTVKEPADIDKFLHWWKDTGCRTKITTPDTQNAIRILTIHKSKGLGFKAVIIPFADWEIEPKSGTIFWCSPREAPFNRLHLTPVAYSKALAGTIFAENYYHEKLYACIDSLNALYVAFTRAKEELIIYAPGAEAKRTKQISALIRDAVQTKRSVGNLPAGEPLGDLYEGFRPDEALFEWGDCRQTGTDGDDSPQEIPMKHIPSILPDKRIRLRLHRKGGFFEDRRRRYGILMHDILSRIREKTDIPAAVESKKAEGELNSEEATELTSRLERLLDGDRVKKWFDGSMPAMNETEILFGNGKSRRPDRIMIDGDRATIVDYKFGEQKDARHKQQIRKYASLIHEIGYQTVTGYVWYVETDEIEEVCSQTLNYSAKKPTFVP